MPVKRRISPHARRANGSKAVTFAEDVIEQAMQGNPIEVSNAGYTKLYRQLKQAISRTSKLRNHDIMRRRIDHSRWQIRVLPANRAPRASNGANQSERDEPYKQYARRLQAGETLMVETSAEAVKARLAWHHYIQPEDRVDFASASERVGGGPKHNVWVRRRER